MCTRDCAQKRAETGSVERARTLCSICLVGSSNHVMLIELNWKPESWCTEQNWQGSHTETRRLWPKLLEQLWFFWRCQNVNSGSLTRTEKNAHMIADEDQRGTAQHFVQWSARDMFGEGSCRELFTCNASPDYSGKPPRNTNRTQFSSLSQSQRKCNQKKCDKSGNKETGERGGEKKNICEYVRKCGKMQFFTTRVLIRRKVSARRYSTFLLIRTQESWSQFVEVF